VGEILHCPYELAYPGYPGLGLAIAQEIVRGHRGEISARNHPDGGAEIDVRLPAAGSP
jgi:signal transduction histidine kinase